MLEERNVQIDRNNILISACASCAPLCLFGIIELILNAISLITTYLGPTAPSGPWPPHSRGF